MISMQGTYFDGVNSKAIPAELVISDGHAELRNAQVIESVPIESLKVDARLGTTPRQITWGHKTRFVTRDNAAVESLVALLPRQDKLQLVAWLEERMMFAIAAVVLTFGAAAVFAVSGVPMIAEAVAFAAPEEVSEQLGNSTLTTIDQLLSPTELPADRQSELSSYFAKFEQVNTVAFRKGDRIGANAFTLSATTVVMTDELVALAERDEELLAVYLHEVGHARSHHVERSILQNSAWVVLFTVIVGDVSGAGELVLSLPLAIGQMAFSRDFEREADRFAIDAMLAAGLDPTSLATILERMVRAQASGDDEESPAVSCEKDASTESRTSRNTLANDAVDEGSEWAQSLLDYFSTHPATTERAAYIRAAAIR
jgi:Zn-dependent protease with chaperone function